MGSTRQLPTWMLRTAATDKVTNSVSVVKRKGKGSKKLPTETCLPDSSVEVAQVETCESEVTTKTDSCSVVKKCITTRSRRKAVKQAHDDGDSSNKRGREVEKENHAPPRRKRKAKVLSSVEESNLSEDELTVDDLISIAKEHVSADKKKKGQRSKSAVFESFKNETTHKEHVNSQQKKGGQRSKPAESESFKKETSHKDSTPSCDIISSLTTVEASTSDLVECQPSENDDFSFSSTGVLTQDMLELFLGPFVKKCSEVKSNPEVVANSTRPDFSSSNQIRDGIEADPSTKPDFPSSNHTGDGLKGDPIPPVKKKGSLKDRIALM